MTPLSPLTKFKNQLQAFAKGERQGIRNPFVMVPVEPSAEQKVAQHLHAWAQGDGEVPTSVVLLDRVLPQTEVFETLLGLPDSFYAGDSLQKRGQREQETLRDNAAQEMVAEIVSTHEETCQKERQVLLLLHLGALFPFGRASELLDELDRRRVQATIGIPFPGRVIGGKLSFFGERARHYYPAHRIDGRITKAHLQEA